MSDIPTGPADVTRPRAALARLALSAAAAELADYAATLVPTIGWTRPGDHVELAAQLLNTAREVLDRAVVYEHDHGTSWREIGETLNVTKQTAHERFAAVVAEWDSGLDEPWSQHGAIRNPRLPEGAADPDRSAGRLDQWCAEHAPAGTRRLAESDGIADRMVSAGLPAHTETSEAASIARQARHLAEHGATDAQREHYQTRKRAVLRRLDGGAQRHPSQLAAGCTCTIRDPGGPNEVRIRDDRCTVHRGR